MSSYYDRVSGTLSPSEIARSEDIHEIQSNITTAFQEMLIDLFGTGCILGDDEEDLKLIPTPYTIDQANTDYGEENPWISFSDIYLRQRIDIEKSEIQAIRVTIQNNTNLMPTVFAEIRDSNFNLIKETNVKLPSQTEDDGQQIDFIFNLQHLPQDNYYFVIRPIDINTADLTANGDETQYDTIDENSFQILCDRNGNYNQSLNASFNGVDYLEARLLDGELKSVQNDFIEVEDENYDLCFEHIFSSGNTYLFSADQDQTVSCIVLGEKIYPVDTHVSIDGPSPNGNRIDLISLDTKGQLNVTAGQPFVGEAREENYPVNNTDFKIAYITTYYGSDSEWYCSNCGTKNNSNITTCSKCGATTNVKAPLIEQDDDNGITRRRDILERLRRLEKKMDYQTEYNSPSRIKYNCTVDPVIKVDEYPPESTYGVKTITNSKGEKIVVADNNTSSTDYTWSIADTTYTYTTGASTQVTVNCKNVYVPYTKPDKSKLDKDKHYIKVIATDDNEKAPIATLTFKVKIKNNKTNKQVGKTLEKSINRDGKFYINPWSLGLSPNTSYKVETSYGTHKMTSYIKMYSGKKGTYKLTNHSMKFNILDGSLEEHKADISKNTFTGKSYFSTDKIKVDPEAGEIYLEKLKNSEQKESVFPSESLTSFNSTTHSYTIHTNKNSLQSEYPLFSITLDRDCYLKEIKFHVAGTKNIKYMKALLFHNDRVFNLNTSRKNYRKYLNKEAAEDTAFANVKKSKDIPVNKNGKAFYYTMSIDKKIKKGTYSLLLYGYLDNAKKDGVIKIKERHTANATKFGVLSRVKGTSTPNQIFMGGENLTNRTMWVKFYKTDDVHNSTGTVISKTVQTNDNIISCKLTHYYDIPNGCYVHTYVSNNGGKTYVEQINNSGTVTFNGYGRELRWRLVFTGNGKASPKLKFNKKVGYAFKVTVETGHKLNKYEDYDRCFATPLLNANNITRVLAKNNNIERPFSEWEYARLWMEEDDLDISDIDICFAYAYNNYNTGVQTAISNWGNDIFFSQIFSSLKASDFARTSVDYDNYNANIEADELNFRFKLETDYMYNLTRTGEIIASPDVINDYSYGDITPANIDMDMFSYGLMDVETVYNDSQNSNNDINIEFGPYYQALYHPNKHTTEVIETEETDTEDETIPTEVNTNSTEFIAWAADSDPDYNDGCIIGVSFNNGLTIEEKYTSLEVDVFPNLRDCQEINDETGELEIINGRVTRKNEQINTKYYNDNDEAYIPGGTLELILSFNQYGLVEENNATYGKIIPITKDLISCKYQKISVNLSDLYNRTIYSIGIRVSANAEYDNNKHPSLQDGDIIGMGNISLHGYNIKPYVPYDSKERKQWTKHINLNAETTFTAEGNKSRFDILDTKGDLFSIKTDINLVPYDYINVQYYVLDGEIHKGDILLDLYDTINTGSTQPIQTLALPAWGAIQQNASASNKTVNAWFKVRTNANNVKCIQLRRANPTGTNTDRIVLYINDILFYNAPQLPALGPQMQMRIYPNNINGTYNTKIRKYGGIYRLR